MQWFIQLSESLQARSWPCLQTSFLLFKGLWMCFHLQEYGLCHHMLGNCCMVLGLFIYFFSWQKIHIYGCTAGQDHQTTPQQELLIDNMGKALYGALVATRIKLLCLFSSNEMALAMSHFYIYRLSSSSSLISSSTNQFNGSKKQNKTCNRCWYLKGAVTSDFILLGLCELATVPERLILRYCADIKEAEPQK